MTKAEIMENKSSLECLQADIYQNAAEFIFGQIDQVESLSWRHSARKYARVNKAGLYSLAAKTCQTALLARQTASSQLAAFLDARKLACEITSMDSSSLPAIKPALRTEFVTLVFSFVQSQCSLSQLKQRLDAVIGQQKVSELTVLNWMDEARLAILAETASMLVRCDQLNAMAKEQREQDSA